ncbi:MAG: DUF6537 domain-containing protein [Burkholderiaceae bacterium]
MPEPQFERRWESFSILVAGIGGTGVVTIGQTLAVAAHADGLFSSNLDVTGLAQKYGAVLSHVKLAARAEALNATRIATAEADTLIGCDLIVSAGDEAFARLAPGRSGGVVCTDIVPTAEFARNPDWRVDTATLADRLDGVLGAQGLQFDALRLSRALLGDTIGANMMLLGAAWQRGQVPLSLAAIDRAIELNGVALELNRKAFLWGRRIAHDREAVEQAVAAMGSAAGGAQVIRFDPRREPSLDAIVEDRSARLLESRDAETASRYASMVTRVREAEAGAGGGQALARAVARAYYKVLAYKDEWEVARLFASKAFREDLESTFDGDYRLRFHVAGGPFGRRDASGRLVKREVGPWLMTAFRLMSRLRGLRDTVLDPFRNSAERRLHEQVLRAYEVDLEGLLAQLDADRLPVAVRIASLPDAIRGYGRVREAAVAKVEVEREALWRAFRDATGETSVTAREAVRAA